VFAESSDRKISASPAPSEDLQCFDYSYKLPDKPVDSELAVIRVNDMHGDPIAIAVNYAAHPTMIPAEKVR
jgi:hypothetical protein